MTIKPTSISGYRPSITKTIRTMIEKYNVKSVLKEFLQNADDAGASELVVTLDLRNHTSITDQDFKVASGSALLISNNVVFSDKDFKAIAQLMAENKLDSPGKTGRFGQGFTSSFSVTDHPSFMSGGVRHGRSMWFDVHESAVCASLGDPVAAWNHEDLKHDDLDGLKGWLSCFMLPEETNIDSRTIFRLPIRTASTANSSDISQQIFNEEHFYEWCDTWGEHPENLLFLRNVDKLVLQEVSSDGVIQEHLRIETKNKKVVKDNKKIINNQLPENSSPEEVCEGWANTSKELPTVSYNHFFDISIFNRTVNDIMHTKSSWAVINGLFRGKNDELLLQAKNILGVGPNFRKVLPWAGVALPINLEKLSPISNGKLFTFLPLDIETKHKVHIHGWFELDDKRTSLILEEGNDDQKNAIEWNLSLAEYAIGPAWAGLLLNLKGELHVEYYYQYWPLKGNSEFDRRLAKGFYNKMATENCLNVHYKDKIFWGRPSEKKYYSKQSSHQYCLSSALQNIVKNKVDLLIPEPPKKVIDELNKYDSKLSLFTPEILISLVEEETHHIDYPVNPNDIEALFFAGKKAAFEILKYAVKGSNKQLGIVGLPLEYRLDGKIHRINDRIMDSKSPNLPAFNNDKSYFLDSELYSELARNEKPASWLEPTLIEQLSVIDEILRIQDLDTSWLNEIVELIHRSGEDQYKRPQIKNLIAKLPIYKSIDQKPKSLADIDKTPLLDSKVESTPYYLKLNIPLYEQSWLESYCKLNRYLGPQFSPFSHVTDTAFFNAVATMDEMAMNELCDMDFRHFVLNKLKIPTDGQMELSNISLNLKKTVPLALTQNNELVALNTEDRSLYLPGDFTVNEALSGLESSYDLINSTEIDFKELFMSLGIKELSFNEFLKQVVIQYLTNSHNLENTQAIIKWLCDEFSKIEYDEEVIALLSDCKFIPAEDGSFVKAKDIYLDSYWITFPTSLKETTKRLHKFNHENWNKLLKLLGAKPSVSACHFLCTAQHIERTRKRENAVSFINFIEANLDGFFQLIEKELNLISELGVVCWLPCIDGSSVISGKVENRKILGTPSSITNSQNKLKLCPSHHLLDPIFESNSSKSSNSSKARFLKVLGIKSNTSIDMQISNYDNLIDYEVSDFNKKLLADISQKLFHSLSNNQNYSVNRKSDQIFLNGIWIKANNVFHSQTFDLAGLMSTKSYLKKLSENDRMIVKRGLDKLGVAEKPDIKFYINYLERRIGLKQKLSSAQVNEATKILDILERDYLKQVTSEVNIPLLATDSKLYASVNMYIDEDGRYESAKQRNNAIKVCVGRFNKLAERTKAKSIKFQAKAIINSNKTEIIPNEKLPIELSEAMEKIIQPWFENAVRRLINDSSSNLHSSNVNTKNERIIPRNIYVCNSLCLSYSIKSIDIYENDSVKVHKDGDHIYIIKGSLRVFTEALAEYIGDKFNFDASSSIAVSTLIKEINSKHEADTYLSDELSIAELPMSKQYSLPESDSFNHSSMLIQEDVPTLTDILETNILGEKVVPVSEAVTNINGNKRTLKIHKKIENSVPNNEEVDNFNQNRKETSTSTSEIKGTQSPVKIENLGNNKLNAPQTNNEYNHVKERRELTNGARDYISHNDVNRLGSYSRGNQATQLGDWGEAAVIQEIGRQIKLADGHELINQAPKNNPGFDLVELNSKCEEIRRIEVKTLSGGWGTRGYHISKTQVRHALEHKKWSLFVLFNANDPNAPASLVNMGNPFENIDTFFFPNIWNTNDVHKTVQIIPMEI